MVSIWCVCFVEAEEGGREEVKGEREQERRDGRGQNMQGGEVRVLCCWCLCASVAVVCVLRKQREPHPHRDRNDRLTNRTCSGQLQLEDQ